MIWIVTAYIIGFLVSYWMLRTEHAADQLEYTFGHRLFNVLFSLLSWVMVLIQLIVGWYNRIKMTGYWSRPIKPKP